MTRLSAGLPIPCVLLLAACSALGGGITGETPVAVMATIHTIAPTPTEEPPPAATDVPSQPPVSFEAATYRDESAGFEFDYPSSWTFGEGEQGDRGAIAQLTSPEGTDMSVGVFLWEPTNDLDSYVEVRKQAWSASGTTIVSEEEVTLAGDRRAVRFVVQTEVGEQAFFMFTTVGERYLQLAGTGDLNLLAEIAQTVRPLGPGS